MASAEDRLLNVRGLDRQAALAAPGRHRPSPAVRARVLVLNARKIAKRELDGTVEAATQIGALLEKVVEKFCVCFGHRPPCAGSPRRLREPDGEAP
jgi:hypothetical protein